MKKVEIVTDKPSIFRLCVSLFMFTGFFSIFCFATYLFAIILDGVPFNESPELCISFLSISGIGSLILGVDLAKEIICFIKYKRVLKYGFNTFGIITDIHTQKSSHIHQGRVYTDIYRHGDIQVLGKDGQLYRYVKHLETNEYQYSVGDVLSVVHYKNDIGVTGTAFWSDVPNDIEKALKSIEIKSEGLG